VLHGILCESLAAYPDVRIDVHLTDERINLVRQGFDLAIRMGTLDDSELTSRRLGSFRRVVCASPGYLAKHGRPQTPADLARHDCLIVDRSLATWRFGGDDGEMAVRVPWRFCVNHIAVLLGAARAGHGIANLPRYLVTDDLASGALVALLADRPQPPVDVTAVYPATRTPSAPLRALIDLLVERLRTSMPAPAEG
jgi:DNA-binding transcriptional LysR family regulator